MTKSRLIELLGDWDEFPFGTYVVINMEDGISVHIPPDVVKSIVVNAE